MVTNSTCHEDCFTYDVCYSPYPGATSQFGGMPPTSLLVSLPVSSNCTVTTTTTLANSFQPPTYTQAGGGAILPVSGQVNFTQYPSLPASHPGLSLSPAADPIPHLLVQRIQAGQFVEMRDLLADNIALINQLTSLHGIVSLPLSTVNRTRLREVPSLISWLYCFNAYVAVRTPDRLTRDMLAYSRILIREALRHGGSGWLEYDHVFRRQLAITPSMPWNTLEPSLQAATVLGQRTSSGTFCTNCQECDHAAYQCALAPLQQQVRGSGGFPVSTQNRPPRRPESLARICVSWNKGRCTVSGCTYRHICAGCHRDHKARVCPDLPPTSEYKQAAVPPQTPTSSGNPAPRQ